MYVRATINGSLHLPETWVGYSTVNTDGYFTLPPTETEEALPSEIAFFNGQGGNAFEIEWEFKATSGYGAPAIWREIGTTKHTVYVVKAAPSTPLRQESLFNIACKAANGTNGTDQQVVDAVFSEFADRLVYRVQRSSGEPQEEPMKYAHDASVPVTGTAATIIALGKGRCGLWATLFKEVALIHGISTVDTVQLEAYDSSSSNTVKQQFLTAYLSHFGTTPDFADKQYSVLYIKHWNVSNAWNPASTVKLAAQGTNNPQPYFYDHALNQFGGKIYDPSYGTKHDDLLKWEDAALDAIGAENVPLTPGVGGALWVLKANATSTRETSNTP